jgi:hypothetical protein
MYGYLRLSESRQQRKTRYMFHIVAIDLLIRLQGGKDN